MGLFDRLLGKKSPGQPASSASAGGAGSPAPETPPVVTPPSADKPAAAGGVLPQLAAARARLVARDVPGAVALYEQIIASAGDRADVLLSASGDLGSHGAVRELIELVAPRYDVDRHGHGPGLNLLQAYLAVGAVEPAQHLLDLLFSLNRPDLEARLIGFSRAIAELSATGHTAGETPSEATSVSLVSISKPIWFYGLEGFAHVLLPAKAGRLRRVAFAQCALPGADPARGEQPEDDTGRFTRGLALWFAETFHASAGYEPFAGLGLLAQKHYALFPTEWTAENVRQLNDSTEGGLDYVLTGALTNRHSDFELTLRIWEVKKFRQLKSFSTRWTPGDADVALSAFHAQLRTYMEWTAPTADAGLAYAPPVAPVAYVQALGASLSLFLHGKEMLPGTHAPADATVFLRAAQANPDDVRAQLLLVTALQRLAAAGRPDQGAADAHARAWLATEAARAAGVDRALP